MHPMAIEQKSSSGGMAIPIALRRTAKEDADGWSPICSGARIGTSVAMNDRLCVCEMDQLDACGCLGVCRCYIFQTVTEGLIEINGCFVNRMIKTVVVPFWSVGFPIRYPIGRTTPVTVPIGSAPVNV
jgi:hypothetical protein